MHANNEAGTVQPIAAITELVKARSIALHTDAAQLPGYLNVSIRVKTDGLVAFNPINHRLHISGGTLR